MPHTLSQIPRTEYGDLQITAVDIAPGAITGALIPQGGILPDQLGILARNQSGSSIPAGSLVYISGWAAGLPLISLAVASGQMTRATWVTLAVIANNANGLIGKHYSLPANTNAATLGDPVYLGLNTPGGYALTNVDNLSLIYQIVGRVAVKAVAGTIDFDVLSGEPYQYIDRMTTIMPQIGAAAGIYVAYMVAPTPATILGGRAVFPTSSPISGTSYVTISITNLSNANAAVLSTVSPANSTFTGGAAITADVNYPLTLSGTPANLVVSGGDLLKVIATVTGGAFSPIAAGSGISLAIIAS
jgi:hypothetical protein